MSRDTMLIVLGWIIAISMLIIFTPRNKIRHACIIFLIKQNITWFWGLVAVELRLLEYPVRSFAYSTKTSFDFEYFIYPAFCVVFNLHYPVGKGSFRQFMHYFYFCTGLTSIEILVEKYTDILHYIHWNWFITWITLFLTFVASRQFYLWFTKNEKSAEKEK